MYLCRSVGVLWSTSSLSFRWRGGFVLLLYFWHCVSASRPCISLCRKSTVVQQCNPTVYCTVLWSLIQLLWALLLAVSWDAGKTTTAGLLPAVSRSAVPSTALTVLRRLSHFHLQHGLHEVFRVQLLHTPSSAISSLVPAGSALVVCDAFSLCYVTQQWCATVWIIIVIVWEIKWRMVLINSVCCGSRLWWRSSW